MREVVTALEQDEGIEIEVAGTLVGANLLSHAFTIQGDDVDATVYSGRMASAIADRMVEATCSRVPRTG